MREETKLESAVRVFSVIIPDHIVFTTLRFDNYQPVNLGDKIYFTAKILKGVFLGLLLKRWNILRLRAHIRNSDNTKQMIVKSPET